MKYAIVIISLIIVAFLLLDFNHRYSELQALQAERQGLEERLLSNTGTVAALKDQIVYATSEAAVAEWAYENHMALPNDKVIVPLNPVQVTPTPTPIPPVVTEQSSKLKQWLLLFFGPKD